MIYDEIEQEFSKTSKSGRKLRKIVQRAETYVYPYLFGFIIGAIAIGFFLLVTNALSNDSNEVSKTSSIPPAGSGYVPAPKCPAAFGLVDHMLEEAESYATAMRAHHQHNVTKGDRGPSVKAFQEFLNKNSDAGLEVDGIYGSQTKAAAEGFIKSNEKQVANTQEFLDHLKDMKKDYENLKEECLQE